MKQNLGLVHVYTGEGKGKTSASLGLALRAVGHNLRVYIIQFLKSGDTGELFAIEKYLPNITVAQYGKEAITDTQTNIHEFGIINKKKGNNG
ncbi:MAG: cob(I)yrinic acid a,c-diamide adenosyltransferase, partial [Nanoarchaeota archaeon]|nr:cob(I)yrinic acid a,c-diamide adenosyltransferase [Nanoarchaeota archaeon]